jgi:hypothetical protein
MHQGVAHDSKAFGSVPSVRNDLYCSGSGNAPTFRGGRSCYQSAGQCLKWDMMEGLNSRHSELVGPIPI